jgi:hypothetical protein
MRIEEPTVDAADAADVAEQRSGPDDAGIGGVEGRTDLPLEADPADVAEQDAAVPFDDDER